MGCGCSKSEQIEMDFEKGTIDPEVFKFLKYLGNNLNLEKYQYRLNDGQDNLYNFLQIMNSPKLGGCILNDSNPLNEQIVTFKPDSALGGRYYRLHNVLK